MQRDPAVQANSQSFLSARVVCHRRAARAFEILWRRRRLGRERKAVYGFMPHSYMLRSRNIGHYRRIVDRRI